ncbi:MAG: GAF domain-containing protein [Anaerolineales bacterium]|nr:GAF domain-containing protein [Anaerolineales bacterium]
MRYPEDILKRQRDELHILHQVAGICIEASDEDDLITRCTALLGEALFTDNFGFILVDHAHTQLKLHPSYHDQPDVTQPSELPLFSSVCGKVVRTGHPILLEDVRQNADYFSVDPYTRSELSVPLKLGEQIIGVINAESRELNAFSEHDARLLMTVASQLGIAISNMRLLRSEARRRKEAETLQHATAALTSSLNLTEVLDTILVNLEQVVPYDSACVFLAEQDLLRVMDARGFPDLRAVLDKTFPAHDPLYQKIRASQRPIYLADAQREAGFHYWGNTPYVRGWMGIPLLSEGKVFGCLTVDSRTPGLYTESHAMLAQAFAHQAAIAIQNARLFDETRRQNRELLALYDTALTLGMVLDRDELLMRIGEQVYLLMAPDSMGIIWYEADQQMLEIVLVIEKGQRMEEAKGLRVPLEEAGLSGWLLKSGKSMLFNDLLTETPPVAPKHIYHPARAWLGVPIFVRGHLSGLITVQSFQPDVFDKRHLQFMEAVASQVAIALENARLFEETRRRAHQLGILNDLAREMTALLDPFALGALVTQRIQESFGYFSVSLSTLTADQQTLTLLGISGGFAVHVKPGLTHLPIEKGVIGRVARTGQLALIQDTSQDPDFYQLAGLRVRSELTVPIVSNGHLIGVLNIDSNTLNAFDETDVRLVTTIADQVAVALDNAYAYQRLQIAMGETRQRAEELSVLFNVSQAIANAPLNSEEIAIIVARQFVEVLGIQECSISLLEPDQKHLRTLVDYYVENEQGHLDSHWVGKNIPITDYPATETVLRSHIPLVVHLSDPQADPQERAYMQSRNQATLVILPLIVKGKPIGILELEHGPHARHYTAEELNLAITLANQAAIALENAQLYEELEESYLQTVLALARAMDARDTYTADHSQRLSVWAEAIAQQLGCTSEQIRAIHWAALLHDIGKIGVPDEILRKPGPLNDLEWAIMKKHPEEGAEIVAPVKRLADVAPIIRAHQEKYDGTGYPDGLKGAQIPLGARILAVVDSFSAMTDNRVYRQARTAGEALKEITRLSGVQYDPDVVNVFVNLVSKWDQT